MVKLTLEKYIKNLVQKECKAYLVESTTLEDIQGDFMVLDNSIYKVLNKTSTDIERLISKAVEKMPLSFKKKAEVRILRDEINSNLEDGMRSVIKLSVSELNNHFTTDILNSLRSNLNKALKKASKNLK